MKTITYVSQNTMRRLQGQYYTDFRDNPTRSAWLWLLSYPMALDPGTSYSVSTGITTKSGHSTDGGWVLIPNIAVVARKLRKFRDTKAALVAKILRNRAHNAIPTETDYEVPIVYKGQNTYIVRATSPETAKAKARIKFHDGVAAPLLGNEWEEIDHIGQTTRLAR